MNSVSSGEEPEPTGEPGKKQVFPMPGYFKSVFLAVLGLTILSFIGMSVLSFCEPLSAHQERLFDTCDFSWKMGLGAIVGLLGGKATS